MTYLGLYKFCKNGFSASWTFGNLLLTPKGFAFLAGSETASDFSGGMTSASTFP